MKTIDKKLFQFVSKIILKMVKKNDYQKSKYTIMLGIYDKFICIMTVIIFCIHPLYLFFARGYSIDKILLSVGIWMPFFAIKIFRRKELVDLEGIYTFIFMRRKEPEVYFQIKKITEDAFKNTIKRRIFVLKILIAAYIVCGLLLFFSWPLFLLYSIESVVDIFILYINYVFDFDPPEQKTKKQDSLTEIMKKVIDSFLKTPALNPS